MRLLLLTLLLIITLVMVWISAPSLTQADPQWQTYSPPAWILGPIEGSDGPKSAIVGNLDAIAKWDLPITAYHFDWYHWQKCAGDGKFQYGDDVLERMRELKIRGLFWIAPLIGINCPEYQVALANNYFVKDGQGNVIVTNWFQGHGSWIDYNNPDAVAYYHTLLDRLRARVGNLLGGFYTDSVRPDNPNMPEYGEAYSLDLINYTRANVPDGDVIMKRYGINTPSDTWLNQNAHVAYVDDLPTDFSGLRQGIQRVFDTAQFMSLPYNEFSGYSLQNPDAETYVRRMHWGAFQPVMEDVPWKTEPWDPHYPPIVMQTYQYYANLHRELAPYLSSYDHAAYETKTPILRDMDVTHYSTRVGNEFFVQYVTDYKTKLDIQLPPGQWINYWNESKVFSGNQTISYKVPLGREPIFILLGAIIPMDVSSGITGHGTIASAGSLTVNVYPTAHSTFQYYDPVTGWLTFDVSAVKQRLSLCTLGQAPSKPLLYRIENFFRNKPNFVSTQNGAIGVNEQWGAQLAERASEVQVANTKSGWYYDSSAQRLIVKLSERGNDCPAP